MKIYNSLSSPFVWTGGLTIFFIFALVECTIIEVNNDKVHFDWNVGIV
jgi:hypothetical protein